MDIYFLEEYGRLYEDVENGKFVRYRFKCEEGEIEHNFIKRAIPKEISQEGYYDLITPYGYGGPIIKKLHGDKNKLIYEFEKKFKHYCGEKKIICEFVRFHPIINNHDLFKDMYEVVYNRETALTVIDGNENNFDLQFSKSARKSVRRALRDGLKYDLIQNPSAKDFLNFREVYQSTLDRNLAKEYYYFDETYFLKLNKHLNNNIIIINIIHNNEIISSALYFVYKEYMHAHLSGTKSEYLRLSPSYLIKYAATVYAENSHIKFIHHGGGVSSKETDPLLKFKKKFTKNETVSFFVGKKIYNKEAYQKLIKVTKTEGLDFFPQYRGVVDEKE